MLRHDRPQNYKCLVKNPVHQPNKINLYKISVYNKFIYFIVNIFVVYQPRA